MSQQPPRTRPPGPGPRQTRPERVEPSMSGYRPNDDQRSPGASDRRLGPSLEPERDPDRRMAERLAPTRPDGPRHQRASGRRPEAPPRDGVGLVTVIAWIMGLLLVVGGGAIAALMIMGPVDLIRSRLIAEVKTRTGRDLVIAGKAGFTVYPSLGVRLTDVSLSAPPGMGGPPTIVMKGLDVRLAALPLLSKRVVVERLVLLEPVIDARIDAKGRQSWQFAMLDQVLSGPTRLAQAAPAGAKPQPVPAELEAFMRGSSQKGSAAAPATSAPGLDVGALDQISFGDVRVQNGAISYTDERSGVAERVSQLNASLSLRSMTSVATLTGDAMVRAERVVFDARLGTVEKLLKGAPAKLDVTLSGGPAKAPFKSALTGDMTTGAAGFNYDGTVKFDATSLAELLHTAGRDVAGNADIGMLSILGRLKIAGTQIALSEAVVMIDKTRLSGAIAVDLVQPRPHITATLESPEINVARITQTAQTIASAPVRATAAVAAPTAAVPAPRSISDLLGGDPQVPPVTPTAKSPKVKGFTQRAGWSDEPIDLTALGAVDIDARIVIGRLLVNALKIGASSSTIALKNQTLRLTVDDVQLYEGRGRGIVQLDATTPSLGFGANISLDGVAAGPLLADAAEFNGITGRSRINLAIAGRGTSERQLIETLTGKGDASFNDGAIVGYNIAGMLRQVSQLKFNGLDRSATEKTNFGELAASFTIANGVATTQDIRLQSPLLRLTGAGTVTLPDRSLDLKLKPKIVGTLAGQGGDVNLTGLEIPVRLAGPWEKPALSPDTAAVGEILKDPAKAADVVKRLGDQLKGGKAEELVRGFLGGGKGTTSGADGQPGTSQQVKPRQLFEQFLKQ